MKRYPIGVSKKPKKDGNDKSTFKVGDLIDIEERTQMRSFFNRGQHGETSFKTVIVYGLTMIVLAGVLIAVVLLMLRNQLQSTQLVVGPRGPMGTCNLSHVNQTFNIAGDVMIGENLTVGDAFFLDDSFGAYSNSSCVVFNSTLPICMTGCLKTNCISPTSPNLNLTIGGPIYTGYPSYFCGTVYACSNLTIGGAYFYWNGTFLNFSGPSNLGSLVDVPIEIGSSGTVDQSGPCMFLNAAQCLIFNGTVSFLEEVSGPFAVSGTSTFDPSIFLHNSSYGLEWTGTGLELFSDAGPLNLTSSAGIDASAPVFNISNDVNIGGTVETLLKLSQNGLQTTCSPGPQTGDLVFSSDCSCLTLSSTSGICLNASGTGGVLVSGPGNFTLNGPDLNFEGGSTIGTNVTVDGTVTTTGDVNVGGNLAVIGNITYDNLEVDGSALFLGSITATNTTNTFAGLTVGALTANVTVSKILTTFNGLGAVFPSGTTMQVASNISISSLPSQLSCSSPIFFPNTPTTPNGSPCVLECTDMQRCSPTVANETVVGNFAVGVDYSSPVIGNATFGLYSGKPLGVFSVNSKLVEIKSNASVIVKADIDVSGNVLQNGNIHPCCSGIGGPAQWLTVEINSVTTSIATSETTVIPFDLIQTPSSSLVPDFNVVTGVFVSPSSTMYSVTVYLSMDPAQYSSGTFRGVTLRRTFSFPTSSTVPIRICSQPTAFAAPPTPFQITCSYTGFFQSGDSFYVTAFYDFVGSLTLNGANSVVVKPTTRLEIYEF